MLINRTTIFSLTAVRNYLARLSVEISEAELATSPTVTELLADLPPYTAAAALTQAQLLRQAGHPPEVVTATLSQSKLRARALEKFGPAALKMRFTPAGLEQATRPRISALHADRFRRAGITHVIDLTAGIGADALAFAAAGLQVTAVEKDPATALIARYNLAEFSNSQVIEGDSLALLPALVSQIRHSSSPVKIGIFADPARRDQAGRRHHTSDYQPPLAELLALRHEFPELGLKLGPALSWQQLPPPAAYQWISWHGSVLELGYWHGALASGNTDRTTPTAAAQSTTAHTTNTHSALIMSEAGAYEFTGTPQSWSVVTLAQTAPKFIFEPDNAIIAAGLVPYLAQQLAATVLTPQIPYLALDQWPATGKSDPTRHSALGACFRVVAVLPLRLQPLREWIREHQIGAIEIKKRGAIKLQGKPFTPESLRAQLPLSGDNRITAIIAPAPTSRNSGNVYLCRRLT